MSNGNSWESCHYIGDNCYNAGCYSSGTISYMLDKHSFVLYTVDASYDGDQIEREPKIQRQIFGYNDEVIAQLRLYPQNNDYGAEEIYNNFRAIVQKIISDCLGKPNMWIKSKNDTRTVISRGSGATCYPDWNSGNPGAEHCSLSTHKERENGKENRSIVFGARPICIDCGSEHYENENISCCGTDVEYCESCGCRIDSEGAYWIEGYAYCGDCVSYCEHCDEHYPNRNVHEIDGRYVCDDCIKYSGDYTFCSSCGEIHHFDYMQVTEDGEWFCEDCAEDELYTCEECGKVYMKEDIFYDDITDEYYCEDCYDNLVEERENEDEDDNLIAN